MSNERELLLHLPRLRRYAQALCCSHQAGDELLMDTVRRLDFVRLADKELMLVALFRLLNGTWAAAHRTITQRSASTPDDCHADSPAHGTAAAGFDQRLAALDPAARQTFLLIAQQGFPRPLAAAILRLQQAEFDALYATSEDAVLSRVSTDVLIIEDDAFVSADLGQIMKGMGHSIAGIAATCQQAVHLAAHHRPGLILCDINLADGSSGINAVNEIIGTASVPVVFITSHPDRLSTSTGNNAAYLVSKPYSAEQIRTVSSQVLFHQGSKLAGYCDTAAA